MFLHSQIELNYNEKNPNNQKFYSKTSIYSNRLRVKLPQYRLLGESQFGSRYWGTHHWTLWSINPLTCSKLWVFLKANQSYLTWLLMFRIFLTFISVKFIYIKHIPSYRVINQFRVTCLFLFSLKSPKKERVFDAFRGYIKRPVAGNVLKTNVIALS